MKAVNVQWSNRPARLVEAGDEVSTIEWLDTGIEQHLSNGQLSIGETIDNYIEFMSKHKIKRTKVRADSGPSKQQQAIDIVRENTDKSRKIVISLIMEKCGMSVAGATTYLYNARKAIREGK